MTKKPKYLVDAIHLTTYIQRYAADQDMMRTAELWVVNSTSPVSERGDHHFNVSPVNGGRSKLLVIPNTFIPVRLDTQAPIAHILESTAFRSALQRKSVSIIDTKDVYAYFAESERARTEYERVQGYPWDSALSSMRLDEDKPSTKAPDVGDMDTGFGTLVTNLLALAETDTPDAVVAALINSSEELNAEQLQHIADNVAASEIRDICMELIADKKGE